MRDDFSLKEILLYSVTMGFTFIYMAMKHLSFGMIVIGQYIAYAIVMLTVCMGVCFLLNMKLNRVIKNFDKQAYMGVEHLRNRMEILDAVVFLDIFLDSLIEIPMLFDPIRGPDNIFTSQFFWYFIICVFIEIVSIRLIGKCFKARKVIGRLEHPLCAKNVDPFAFTYDDSSASDSVKTSDIDPLLLSKLPQEDMIPDEEDFRQQLQKISSFNTPASESEAAEQELKECPFCGSKNPPECEQCVFCGGELDGGRAGADTDQAVQDK